MGSSGSSTPQNIVTTQNKDPWSGAQPYLANVMGEAARIYGGNLGGNPYLGQTVAAQDPYQQQVYSATGQIASQGLPTIDAARQLGYQIQQNQGMTPGIQGAVNNLGSVNNVYGNIAGLQGGLNQNQWDTLGALNADAGLYGNMYMEAAGNQNPYLQSVLDAQGRKIADQVNSTMSGAGRYGSGAHTNVLSRNLAEAANPILAQDYQNRQAQKMQAIAGQQSIYGQTLGALQQGIGNQFTGAQGVGQTQQAIADLYGQGLNRAGQYAQLAPTLDVARYSDLDRLAGVGNAQNAYNQNILSGFINQFNAQQAYPWENLARYSAIANGAGGLGGTTVTSQPNVNMPAGGLTGALGGALAGGATGSIFGPVGAGIGALGGGLLGYLR